MTSQAGPADGEFIGRKDLLAALTTDLGDRQLRADSLTGPLGIGKTRLLRQADVVASSGKPRYRTLFLDMDDFDPGCVGDLGDEISLGAGIKNYTAIKRLGRNLVDKLAPETAEDFEEAVKRAHEVIVKTSPSPVRIDKIINKVDAAAGSTVQGSGVNIRMTHQLSQAFNQAGMIVTDALVNCLNADGKQRPFLLLVDNAGVLVGQAIGVWLRSAIEGLEKAAVVLTFEPGASLDLPKGLGATHKVPPFSVAEVQEYLETHHGSDLGGDAAEVIHGFSGGHPVVVGLIRDLLLDPHAGVTLDNLRERMGRLPADPDGRLAVVVNDMVQCFEGRRLDAAIQAASIPERCDAKLLKKLLKVGFDVEVNNLGEVMQELESFSFTDNVADEGGKHYYVRVHPFIRKALATQLQHYDEGEGAFQKMHAAAYEHYYSLVRDEKRGYGELFAYEKPDNQRNLRAWLYHLAHSDDSEHALRQPVRVFLDAFWWWGSYVHFDFCEEIATDLQHLAADTNRPGFTVAAQMIRQILDEYPKRSHQRLDPDLGRYAEADWDTVRNALLQLRLACGLSRLGDSASAQDLQLRALLHIFMAHAKRYGKQGPAAGVEGYDEAIALVEAAPDMEWDLAWVQFEAADLQLDLGNIDEALTRAAGAARTLESVEDVVDHELRANIHRLRADCHWARGDLEEAAREYGVSCLHSYLYHPDGGPPDEYTMQHYLEVRARAMERLMEVWDPDQPQRAVRLAEVMRSVVPPIGFLRAGDFEALLREGTLIDLALALFPRGPEVAELHQEISPFMTEWVLFDDAVGKTMDHDLGVSEPSRSAG